MTLKLVKNVKKWNGQIIEDSNYIEQLTINQLGLVIASERLNSEYLGFYFPFITSVDNTYIVVEAFAYPTWQVPDGIFGENMLQFIQDMQKWDYNERYWFASAGYLLKYEYRVTVHPYVLPHLVFTTIASVFIGLGYWKIEQPPFFWKKDEIS